MDIVSDRALINPVANKLRAVIGRVCLSAVSGACFASFGHSKSAALLSPPLVSAPWPGSVPVKRELPPSQDSLLEVIAPTIVLIPSKSFPSSPQVPLSTTLLFPSSLALVTGLPSLCINLLTKSSDHQHRLTFLYERASCHAFLFCF